MNTGKELLQIFSFNHSLPVMAVKEDDGFLTPHTAENFRKFPTVHQEEAHTAQKHPAAQ